ncbi:hypothetical protein BDW69DRAFT_157200 [Aspergillus filifer]
MTRKRDTTDTLKPHTGVTITTTTPESSVIRPVQPGRHPSTVVSGPWRPSGEPKR